MPIGCSNSPGAAGRSLPSAIPSASIRRSNGLRSLVREPRFIEVHRLGTFPERSLDIDVVFDLMIHDLDVVLNLVGGEVSAIEAVGVPVLTPRVDIANVTAAIFAAAASRTSPPAASAAIACARSGSSNAMPICRSTTPHRKSRCGAWCRWPVQAPGIEGGKLEVAREEPLKRELEDFVAAIREKREPVVTGAQGRAALELAEQVVERMEMAT